MESEHLPSLDLDGIDVELPSLDLPPRPKLTERDYANLRKRYRPRKGQKPARKGRPVPSLSDPRVQYLLEALEAGAFVQDAARGAGLSPRSVWRWIERGKAEGEEGTEGSYWQLWHAIEAARLIAHTQALAVIMEAADRGNWRAAAWWLERAHPEKWSLRRTRGRHGQHPPAGAAQPKPSPADLASLEAKVLAILNRPN